MKVNFRVGVAFCAALLILGITSVVLGKKTSERAGTVQAPRFEVDPMWPKPLPNHWVIGNTIGVSVDAQDHVWIIHRASSLEHKEIYAAANPPEAECCLPAPPVLEFDQAGNLLASWGWSRRRLRLAGFESWHHRRFQRQRLDRRQRSWARAQRSGSERRSRWQRHRSLQRQHGAQVYAERKVPDADR
jgi:hypothetical protein